MVDWNYTGPKRDRSKLLTNIKKNKDILIFDAGCGTGLVGVELKETWLIKNFHGADLSTNIIRHKF